MELKYKIQPYQSSAVKVAVDAFGFGNAAAGVSPEVLLGKITRVRNHV